MSTLPVIETFSSLQGESTHAGRRCFFIRLAQCNLRCNYCDTTYAWDGGTPREIGELAAEAAASGMDIVEVTGGEPLIHPETPELIRELLKTGMEVLIETNGSMDISVLPYECRKIVDCKTPGSGMAERNRWENFAVLAPHDEVKFVVSSPEDFHWSLDVIDRYRLSEKTAHLIFSPVWGRISFEELAALVTECRQPVRMQLQMHKLIWGDKKGV
jgi:7-carboxy-7-deazaguanine synthase